MDRQQGCDYSMQPGNRSVLCSPMRIFTIKKHVSIPTVKAVSLDLISGHKKEPGDNRGQFGLISIASIFPGLLRLLRSCWVCQLHTVLNLLPVPGERDFLGHFLACFSLPQTHPHNILLVVKLQQPFLSFHSTALFHGCQNTLTWPNPSGGSFKIALLTF